MNSKEFQSIVKIVERIDREGRGGVFKNMMNIMNPLPVTPQLLKPLPTTQLVQVF